MSRTSDGTAATNYLELASAIVSTAPLTMATWFRVASGGFPTDLSSSVALTACADEATNTNFFLLVLLKSGANNRLSFRVNDGNGIEDAEVAVNLVINTWYLAVGTATDASTRSCWLWDGTTLTEGTNSVSRTPAGLDNTTAFMQHVNAGRVIGFNGRLAQIGMWNITLSDSEVRSLTVRTPNRIDPANLQGYFPLLANTTGDAIDYTANGNDLIRTGTIGIADHAPVSPMFGFDEEWQGAFGGAAPAVFAAYYQQWYRNMVVG